MQKRPLPTPREAQEILAHRRTKPVRSGAPRAGALLKGVLAPLQKQFGPGLARLEHHWPEIIGERLASRARPDSLKRQNGEGVLVIACEGAAASLVQHQARTIVDRANHFLGGTPIQRLRVVQTRRPTSGPLSPRLTPQPPSSPPQSPAPKSSLEHTLKRLGDMVTPQQDDNRKKPS